ncbi:hypothetical protein Q7P35_009782 [Cladosporium inversicolor]
MPRGMETAQSPNVCDHCLFSTSPHLRGRQALRGAPLKTQSERTPEEPLGAGSLEGENLRCSGQCASRKRQSSFDSKLNRRLPATNGMYFVHPWYTGDDSERTAAFAPHDSSTHDTTSRTIIRSGNQQP